ncbi:MULTISPECIES: nucleotidyltransferase domain-containing protein [Maricaulis]|uniref:Nucleotidyltransferase n=1 Tax=Maricaulis maris (strain MCS10) TaxID=394221 RepID=Q0ATC2_MARMM|nr:MULTISPECIES: nucleotidyltransferase domain-containing protein [Maricaulis]ABI64465.1 hypothetical protein Mmar10_0169 [Maricaulis maris MCS10]MAC89601.1 nucleotidyltransferase domain-containing protein [Maricaulis sp.]
MTTIAFNPSISPAMHDTILNQLRQIETRENVRILFAIESGSRAWGFPSPDSDYDARFVYARPRDWYLSLEPGRDVIELPIDGDLDINGWDIKKALNLLLKPNPVLLEWLSSPIRYMWDETTCARLKGFAERVAHGPACVHHYFNLGESLLNRHIAPKDQVNLKKYFYIVRPAMALRWVRMHADIIPPMNFQELLAGIDVSAELTDALNELLIAKSQSKEVGLAPRVGVIDAFIEAEFDWAREVSKGLKSERRNLRDEADGLFRDIVEGSG